MTYSLSFASSSPVLRALCAYISLGSGVEFLGYLYTVPYLFIYFFFFLPPAVPHLGGSWCWLFLSFCTWVVKRSDQSTVIRSAWTRPPARRPSGSCNPWDTLWHCSTSAPLACALIDQAKVSVPLRLGSKAERPVHSAPISPDSASGPTPQWELQSLGHVVALLTQH